MTPKEKAKELCNKYEVVYYMSMHDLEECAIIAVQEIINTGALVNRSCGYLTLNETHVEYWDQVKQEIELI